MREMRPSAYQAEDQASLQPLNKGIQGRDGDHRRGDEDEGQLLPHVIIIKGYQGEV